MVKCFPGVCSDVDSTSLDDYNIHVIGSVFKQWLRDLPNPLLTFELYEEFIRAMGKRSVTDIHRLLCWHGFYERNKQHLVICCVKPPPRPAG